MDNLGHCLFFMEGKQGDKMRQKEKNTIVCVF